MGILECEKDPEVKAMLLLNQMLVRDRRDEDSQKISEILSGPTYLLSDPLISSQLCKFLKSEVDLLPIL